MIAAALAIPAAAYLLIRPKGAEDNGLTEVADLNQLKIGKPEEVIYLRKRVDGWHKATEKASTWLVRTDEHSVIAFNPACTHLGCAYHWDAPANHFICPCHGSAFSIDGKVLSGPAPRPLDRYVAKVEDGKILIGSAGRAGLADLGSMLRHCLEVDRRTNRRLSPPSIISLTKRFPRSAGWHQVFGSVALFAFLVQVVTGLLMAVNYAPTPGEAWESLRYIVTQVTAGSIIRALHHWGASAMIIVVVLHMAQTFLWGAYKKPREATWILGVLLLLLTLAFGLSGYLLSWDNRAYWATMVTTRITALAPGGAILLRLLGTDGSFDSAASRSRGSMPRMSRFCP